VTIVGKKWQSTEKSDQISSLKTKVKTKFISPSLKYGTGVAIAPLSKEQVSGHVICRFFPWKHCWVHRVRALEYKVRVLEMEQSCRLYCSSLIWWFILIVVTSFRLLKNSNHHRVLPDLGKIVIHWPVHGYKKVWGPLPYGISFKHLFLDKTFLGHQQCSQLRVAFEKQSPSSWTRFKLRWIMI